MSRLHYPIAASRCCAGRNRTQDNVSAEDMLRVEEEAGLHPDYLLTSTHAKRSYQTIERLGQTGRAYVRALPKELLRLRSLVARGRAQENMHATRTRTKTPREIALLFAPTFPNELFWKVASYWNPRSLACVR